MAGNAREWVQDWYDPHYYPDAPERNPTGPEKGVVRSIRGGSGHILPSADIGAASRGGAEGLRFKRTARDSVAHGAASDVENAQGGWFVTMEQKDKGRSEPDEFQGEKTSECDRCGARSDVLSRLTGRYGSDRYLGLAMHDVRGGDRSTHP